MQRWNTLARHTALQYWSTAHFCMSVIGSCKFHPYSFKLRLDEPYFKGKFRITCHPQPVSLLYLPWDRKWKLLSQLFFLDQCWGWRSSAVGAFISLYASTAPGTQNPKWKAPPTIKLTLPKMDPWRMRPAFQCMSLLGHVRACSDETFTCQHPH